GSKQLPRRKWNVPFVEADPQYVEHTPEGMREGVRAAFCDEDIEMFRQGYKCIDCWELLDAAFPDECFVCGFEVEKYHADLFAQRFGGLRALGSRINEDEELERMARQRDERERREGLKTKGIWVP